MRRDKKTSEKIDKIQKKKFKAFKAGPRQSGNVWTRPIGRCVRPKTRLFIVAGMASDPERRWRSPIGFGDVQGGRHGSDAK
jgi:hypothetical protein